MALMRLRNLSVEHRLNSVSLTIERGEVLGLIGPNGSGKTSLLHAIAGLLEKSGQIEFEGQNLELFSARQRARDIALQPQFVQSAWALSVHDVVSLGRLPWGDTDQALIKSAMKQAKVMELSERPVNELSGGEKARVWTARVLANRPQLLLMDEPVANLDIHYQTEIMQLLRDYSTEGHAVMIAIHDLSLAARYCDRLCLLNQGEPVQTGPVDEVLTEERLSQVFSTAVFIDLQADPPVVLPK